MTPFNKSSIKVTIIFFLLSLYQNGYAYGVRDSPCVHILYRIDFISYFPTDKDYQTTSICDTWSDSDLGATLVNCTGGPTPVAGKTIYGATVYTVYWTGYSWGLYYNRDAFLELGPGEEIADVNEWRASHTCSLDKPKQFSGSPICQNL